MNDKFPGLPDYVGPTSGWFTFLHHKIPYEYSDDVMERIAYINNFKPENEVATRLRHIVYVGPETPPLWAESERVRAPARAEYESVTVKAFAEFERVSSRAFAERVRAPAWAESERVRAQALAEYERVTGPALAEVGASVAALIPDCTWDGKSLVFPEAG